jgi:transposase
MIAAKLVSKFCDHSPIRRQANRLLNDYHYTISEGSFCHWRDEVGEILLPFSDFIKERILMSRCINTDATTAKYRLPNEDHRLVSCNEYVRIGNDDQPYNYYDFQPNQSQKGILGFLSDYSCYVQCAAHGNYDALFKPKIVDLTKPPPIEVGCHAHARRKFKDIEKLYPEQAKQLLRLWQKLYKIETEVKNRPDDECLFRRQEESVPLLNQLFDGCQAVQLRVDFLPKSVLGQAVAYALNNEMALRRYCTKGWLNIDNNISERAVKPFVLGRKNWLFFGSPDAAVYSSTIMTVLASATRHGLNDLEYLIDLLYRLPQGKTAEDFEQLLPDRWVKSVESSINVFSTLVAKAKADVREELFVKTRTANSVDEPNLGLILTCRNPGSCFFGN